MNKRIWLLSGLALAALLVFAIAGGWYFTSVPEGVAQGVAQVPTRGGRPIGPLAQFNTDNLTLPYQEIQSGGPPKDGIPSLTDPDVIPLDQARYRPDERMLVMKVGDKVRGYPVSVLNWHEAVNDTLGDLPLTVVYCPLCDSFSAVDRRVTDPETGQVKVLEFGISGLLHNSNVLLYDRQDEALWSQVKLEAVSGPHAGMSLAHLPWRVMTLERLKQTHPEATVLSLNTGHQRPYHQNPYADYFRTQRLMFPVSQQDRRLLAKDPVVGIRLGDQTRAYPVAAIRQALDGTVEEKFNGETLILQADADGGIEVVAMPSDAQVVHTFWFTWAAYHPETTLYGEDG